VIELYDTSAMILAARNAEASRLLGDALAADDVAICEPVLLEYLNGARNASEYQRFGDVLRAMRLVPGDSTDWSRALDVHRQLAADGPGHQRSVKPMDLLIAAIAARAGLPLVHYDEDYDRVAAVTGQPTRWIVPRGSAR
jgi:predicted nucleic acid-binding protein